MENFDKKSTQFDLSFKKYFKQVTMSSYIADNLIAKENTEDLILMDFLVPLLFLLC